MHAHGDDRFFFTELRGCTAELARIIDGDLERPVPTCPGWTFRQLATHVGRGHRWAAQIVSTRATMPIPTREVADGKLPQDPAQHAPWLNAGAERVVEAVTAAGSDLVAVDATCCRIMGIDPQRLEYLRLSAERGHVLANQIEQRAEPIISVRNNFVFLSASSTAIVPIQWPEPTNR